MTDEEKTPATQLTTKQKVMSLIVVAIFAFIIYEVIDLFSGGGNSITPPPPAAVKAGGKSTSSNAGGATPATKTVNSSTITGAPQLPTVSALNIPKDNQEEFKQQEQEQKMYIDSLNQLQQLKVKREIAETNQAIAVSALATATANKNMSDLLTQPTLGASSVNPYIGSRVVSASTENSTVKMPTPMTEIPFIVISVSMQSEHWNAVLSYQGKLYSVSIGDSLVDGSVVASINRNGVMLVKNGVRRKINIVSSI